MKHLQMDKDTLLRKQVHDEIQSLFDSRLKEAKRGKSEAEQELEAASEKWRSERRRLNSEIDRLEAALTESREKHSKKAAAAAKTAGIDPMEVARMRAADEERLKLAAKEWDAEKGRLLAQHERLEKALAEAIERSNNPLRSTQQMKSDFEQKLSEAVRARQQLEEEFRKAERQWAEEKQKLPARPGKARRFEEDRRFKELNDKLSVTSSQAATEREQWKKHTQGIEAQLVDAARKLTQLQEEHRSLKLQLQEERANHQAQIAKLEHALSEARKLAPREDMDEIRKEYDRKNQEMLQQKMDLSQELQAVNERLEAERARFEQELRVVHEKSEAERARSTEELQAIVERLQAEQTRFMQEHSRSENHSKTTQSRDDDSLNAAIDAEIVRINGAIKEIVALIDNPDTELSTVIRKNVEKAELDAYLRGIRFSAGKGKALA